MVSKKGKLKFSYSPREVFRKSGSAHFEMIISFVFFVGFVFFLFVVLRAEGVSNISGAVVFGLYDSFEEEVHVNLSDVFLKTNYSGGVGCFYIELPGKIFTYGFETGNSYVTNLGGVDVDSGLEGSGVSGDLNLEDDGNYFRVAVSPEFSDEGLGGCDLLEEYELGSINERRVVSYSALGSMAEEYYTDYESLKSDLRVPVIFDFAIVPETLTTVSMEPQSGIPSSDNVVVRDYVVEVLYTNGTLINERFSFKIW